jgi:hypothetical protein
MLAPTWVRTVAPLGLPGVYSGLTVYAIDAVNPCLDIRDLPNSVMILNSPFHRVGTSFLSKSVYDLKLRVWATLGSSNP